MKGKICELWGDISIRDPRGRSLPVTSRVVFGVFRHVALFYILEYFKKEQYIDRMLAKQYVSVDTLFGNVK